jgi:hypothetical protein
MCAGSGFWPTVAGRDVVLNVPDLFGGIVVRAVGADKAEGRTVTVNLVLFDPASRGKKWDAGDSVLDSVPPAVGFLREWGIRKTFRIIGLFLGQIFGNI